MQTGQDRVLYYPTRTLVTLNWVIFLKRYPLFYSESVQRLCAQQLQELKNVAVLETWDWEAQHPRRRRRRRSLLLRLRLPLLFLLLLQVLLFPCVCFSVCFGACFLISSCFYSVKIIYFWDYCCSYFCRNRNQVNGSFKCVS